MTIVLAAGIRLEAGILTIFHLFGPRHLTDPHRKEVLVRRRIDHILQTHELIVGFHALNPHIHPLSLTRTTKSAIITHPIRRTIAPLASSTKLAMVHLDPHTSNL
jgi:hypothetical protein